MSFVESFLVAAADHAWATRELTPDQQRAVMVFFRWVGV